MATMTEQASSHAQRRRGRPPKKSWDATYKNQQFDEGYVVLPDACWYWIRNRNHHGYGLLYWQGKQIPAHRYSYLRFVGPIPDGLELDHLCRVPSCVNWRHLEAVTHRVNMLRSAAPSIIAYRSGVCQNGHAAAMRDKRGQCVPCRKAAVRRRYIRNSAVVQKERQQRKEYQARRRASLTPDELRQLREFDRIRIAKKRAVDREARMSRQSQPMKGTE